MPKQRGAEAFLKLCEYHSKKKEDCPISAGTFDQVLIISCIDKRILSHVFKQLSDHAYIYRNGGSRPTEDFFRSASAAIAEAGVDEIILLMHTDCLFEKLTDNEIRADLYKNLGPCARDGDSRKCEHSGHCNRDKIRNADYIAYATFKDLRRAVEDGVARIRQNPLISKYVRISGMYYDVDKDKVIPVTESPGADREKC